MTTDKVANEQAAQRVIAGNSINGVTGKPEFSAACTDATNYGCCPICGSKGISRERRQNGNDECSNGHTYPSEDAFPMTNETATHGAPQAVMPGVGSSVPIAIPHAVAATPLTDELAKRITEERWLGWNTAIHFEYAKLSRDLERKLRAAEAELDDAHKQIKSLQAKVPPRPDERPRNPREG